MVNQIMSSIINIPAETSKPINWPVDTSFWNHVYPHHRAFTLRTTNNSWALQCNCFFFFFCFLKITLKCDW
uniref:Uncharacterized protein n=1 Tax=Arundo donax TaxID=35708 RepID=A0A0A9D928_ARUDO